MTSTSFNRTNAPTQSSCTVSGGDDDDSSLDDLITFYTQERDSLQNPTDCYIDEEDMDFEEFITFSTLMEEQKAVVETVSPTLCKIESDESMATHRASATPATLPVTTPVTVSDVPFIMSQLPLDFRTRFLEKFAESAAVHYCAVSSQQVDITVRQNGCFVDQSIHEIPTPVGLQLHLHEKIEEKLDLVSREWSRV